MPFMVRGMVTSSISSSHVGTYRIWPFTAEPDLASKYTYSTSTIACALTFLVLQSMKDAQYLYYLSSSHVPVTFSYKQDRVHVTLPWWINSLHLNLWFGIPDVWFIHSFSFKLFYNCRA